MCLSRKRPLEKNNLFLIVERIALIVSVFVVLTIVDQGGKIMDKQLKTYDEITLSIKDARKSCHLTQEQAAAILGYSERQYRRFEKDGVFDIQVLLRIAEAFNVDLINILFK